MTRYQTTYGAVIALFLTSASSSLAGGEAELVPAMPAQSIERLVVRVGNGDGTVGDATDLVSTENLAYQRILLVHDVDGDGDADLVLHGTKTLRILLGDGQAGFAAQAFVGMPPNTNLVAPLQLDAERRGLAIAQRSPRGMMFYELKDGAFVRLDDFVSIQGTPQEIHPARLNGDQQTDYIVRSQTGSGETLTDIVSVHISNEQGGYTSSALSLAPQLASIAVVDLNLDQLSDLLVFTRANATPQLYLGDQFSALGADLDSSFLAGQVRVASNDFDKDGLADLVIAAAHSQQLQIVPVRQDAYGEAVTIGFDDQDLTGVQQQATVSEFWTADVNGDGIADIVAHTSSFGYTGCCTRQLPDNNPTDPLDSAGGCTVAAELPLSDLTLPGLLLVMLWASRRRNG